ncbi:WD40-repeat-containing domain protein [Mycena maculata]|uniref:WD40-repeat-containing domain protein n=1 Tax=Mycena maculata TaxID=230809 RepID=A0AAD7K2A7_9AGAR|nr:WD40-repeat-containing domain protein [Mycena maculata]
MPSDSEPDDDGLDVEDDAEEYDQEEDEPEGAQDEATEDGDEESPSEDSEDGSDDDGDDSSEPSGETLMDLEPEPSMSASDTSSQPASQPSKVPSSPPAPVTRKRSRSLSPASVRKKNIISGAGPSPRTYTVEAICALPHPVPTHALAASVCMTHLITGSDDGYIRDYDIFTAVNGKNFLTAPQRHHAGVVEGIMKSGQIRFWWENPAPANPAKLNGAGMGEDEPALSPVYSLAMHSDALWTLAGNDVGHINLFTTRHDPGRCCHIMTGHRGRPVSALAMDHDEKGFYSAGWDGDAIQWDLNNGYPVRTFTAHGAQLACVAVRPLYANHAELSKPDLQLTSQLSGTTLIESASSGSIGSQPYASQAPVDSDAKSDASFDPLFDDEEEAEASGVAPPKPTQFVGGAPKPAPPSAPPARAIAPPKNAPPLLDAATCGALSADVLMTASIDGQVILWDKRAHTPGTGVGRLWMSEKTPPWCLSACWSADGGQIYAGRRNGTIDVWDTRQLGRAGPTSIPRLLKTLRNPASSGVVSCVVAFPDGKHIASASIDNLRLWNAVEAAEPDASGKMKSGVQFKIIPGHHGGYISQMLVDPAARFLVSASSNRGWHGDSTKTVFVHDIKHVF